MCPSILKSQHESESITVGDHSSLLREMGIDIWVCRNVSAAVNVDASLALPVESSPGVPMTRATLANWESLRTKVAGCTRCSLHASRTQTVFGVGATNARWMIIGEAPGAQEDAEGEPFVGRAGKLLNNMLLALGLKREEVYIANILKCRPPQNRDPAPEEATSCREYLDQQIEWIKPAIILAVGRIAAQNLLATSATIGRLRGDVHQYRGTPVIVTYHPAYLLRSPLEKRKSWDDLRLAAHTMREQTGQGAMDAGGT